MGENWIVLHHTERVTLYVYIFLPRRSGLKVEKQIAMLRIYGNCKEGKLRRGRKSIFRRRKGCLLEFIRLASNAVEIRHYIVVASTTQARGHQHVSAFFGVKGADFLRREYRGLLVHFVSWAVTKIELFDDVLRLVAILSRRVVWETAVFLVSQH